jgi:hypothetical protein
MGLSVPNFRFLRTVLLTNHTSATKGVLPPNGRFISFWRIGILLTDNVFVPGPNMSAIMGHKTKRAKWCCGILDGNSLLPKSYEEIDGGAEIKRNVRKVYIDLISVYMDGLV